MLSKKDKNPKSWLVQLATGTKRKILEYIPNCDIGINGKNTMLKLNVLALGSCDILIGMDWLESNKVLVICYDKSFVYQDENGLKRTIQGLRKPVSVRQLSTM
jgi:hypothetical protein